MEFPNDDRLPFFAYGIFRKGEFGILRIREFLAGPPEPAWGNGLIFVRDGLPLLQLKQDCECRGEVLRFRPGTAACAYSKIIELELDTQYEWGVADVRNAAGENFRCNALMGLKPEQGSVLADDDWSSKSDPLFKEALDIVRRILQQYGDASPSHETLLQIHMAYLLLWTSIERYASLRYSLGPDVVKKLQNVATEAAFRRTLNAAVRKRRKVFRADRPEASQTLDPEKPKKAIHYYYQVRCNASHRGKGAPTRDFEILSASLRELFAIFEAVLADAWADASASVGDAGSA